MQGVGNVAYVDPGITNLIYKNFGSYTTDGGWSSFNSIGQPLSGLIIFVFNDTSFIDYNGTSGPVGNAFPFLSSLSIGDRFQISYVDGSGYGIYTVSSTPFQSVQAFPTPSSWHSFNVTLVSASGTVQNTNLVISNPVYFPSSGPISAMLTNGLLSVFTNDSGAVPIGGRMAPRVTTQLTQPEPFYMVVNSIYNGTYFINRNDTVGETFYSNWSSSGKFSLFDFYNYRHWPSDQRLEFRLITSPNNPFYGFRIKILGHGDVMYLFSGTDYSSPLDYYGVFPFSTGSFSPSLVNTGWNLDFDCTYDTTQNSTSPYTQDWNIRCADYHTGDSIYTANFQLGDLALGPPGTIDYQTFSIYIDYWRCPTIFITIS